MRVCARSLLRCRCGVGSCAALTRGKCSPASAMHPSPTTYRADAAVATRAKQLQQAEARQASSGVNIWRCSLRGRTAGDARSKGAPPCYTHQGSSSEAETQLLHGGCSTAPYAHVPSQCSPLPTRFSPLPPSWKTCGTEGVWRVRQVRSGQGVAANHTVGCALHSAHVWRRQEGT